MAASIVFTLSSPDAASLASSCSFAPSKSVILLLIECVCNNVTSARMHVQAPNIIREMCGCLRPNIVSECTTLHNGDQSVAGDVCRKDNSFVQVDFLYLSTNIMGSIYDHEFVPGPFGFWNLKPRQ